MRSALVICVAVLAMVALGSSKPLLEPPGQAPPRSRAGEEYRLPNSTAPLAYRLVLYLDPNQQENFGGEVEITVLAQEPTAEIVMHSYRIDINGLSVTEENDDRELLDSWSVETDDTQFLRLRLRQQLQRGLRYRVFVSYSGHYGENNDGAYLSSYVNDLGVKRFLVTTQMESTSARQVLPCYDEPGLKATFQINIYAPSDLHVISNTDVLNFTNTLPNVESFELTEFQPTPIMSTYLIAFIVSDFDYKSNLEHGPLIYPKKFRSFARPNAKDELDFSVASGQSSLLLLERYTGVPYAISKLDNAALPDFSAGAMENWGLLTYREEYMLENNETSTMSRQEVAATIAHENTHMWFGDEVTPAWWNYLWLSEGFATYFEHLITDMIYPSWRMMEQFVITEIGRSMQQDALETTNAMNNDVFSPDEIDSNFNVIAYQKAGSIIRMVQHILGESVFQKGLGDYLRSIPKGSGRPEILYSALNDAAVEANVSLPTNLGEVFDSWANAKGFPLIIATRVFGDREHVFCQQYRYFTNKTLWGGERYWVPVNVATAAEPDFSSTLPIGWVTPTSSLLLDVDSTQGWFLLNKHVTGFYRVMYDLSNWAALTTALVEGDHEVFPPVNRAQLLTDVFDFAKTDRLSYNVSLDMAQYLVKETDYIPWAAVTTSLTYLNVHMLGTGNYSLFVRFIEKLNQKVYAELGFVESPSDDAVTKLNRAQILNLACNARSLNCLQSSSELLANFTAGGPKIVPDLRSVVYCAGLRLGTQSLWDSMWALYVGEDQAADRSLLLGALGCTGNTETLDAFLQQSVIEGGAVRDQDRHSVVEAAITSGPEGVERALLFLIASFDDLQLKVSAASGTRRIINALGSGVVTQNHIDLFETFSSKWSSIFTPREVQAIERAREDIAINENWQQNILPTVEVWLQANVQ